MNEKRDAIPPAAVIALRALSEKIRAWMNDDASGYDTATELLCDVADDLDALLARVEPPPQEQVLSETWMASVMGGDSEEVFYVSGCGWSAQILGYYQGVGPYFSLPAALRRVEAIIGECAWEPRRIKQSLAAPPSPPTQEPTSSR